ncbi:guanine deaminase [Seiridium cupressi]
MAPPKNEKNQIFLGSFIYNTKLDELAYMHQTAVFVDKAGKIVAVEQQCDEQKASEISHQKLGWDSIETDVKHAAEGEFFFPGFIDTHLHAPQYPNVGIFGNSTLLDWLETYTFPMEASLSDLSKARRVYTRCVRRTLSHGTTTAAYYATIDVPATNLLADLCLSMGQRAFVGRVCMDHKELCPDYYRDESPDQVMQATQDSIAHIRKLDPDYELVSPILTPRFAPGCTTESMTRLGKLAAETGLPVQTHISENVNEIKLVKDMFPEAEHYAGVYDEHGLLTPKTILAHGIHLSEAEVDLIKRRGSKISHCPCSNSSITSGEARVRWLLEKGVGVGLGTDMSGGYSPSILEAARLALLVSRHLAMPHHEHDSFPEAGADKAKLSVEEVLYLATRGGAEVVGLDKKLGAFEVGMEFDAQLISLGAVGETADGEQAESEDTGNVDVFGWETWEERVAKWVFNGDDRNTTKVWVKGRLVHSRSTHKA